MEEVKGLTKKVILWNLIVLIGLFLVSSFCFFINQMWIPLGLVLGGIIAIINHFILHIFATKVFRPGSKYAWLTSIMYLIRMLIYALGFFICIFLQYRLELKLFFWGSCLASYIIFMIVMRIVYYYNDK